MRDVSASRKTGYVDYDRGRRQVKAVRESSPDSRDERIELISLAAIEDALRIAFRCGSSRCAAPRVADSENLIKDRVKLRLSHLAEAASAATRAPSS